jgi:uncharacterized protein
MGTNSRNVAHAVLRAASPLLGTLGLLCAAVTSLSALDVKSLKPQGYVSDFANVLDPQSRVQLEAYAGRVERTTGVQMALVTLKSLDGEPIEDVSNTLFRQWGVGKHGKDEGIMLLLAVQDKRDRIEVGYGLEPILPDGFDGSILRGIAPLLKQGAYGQAVISGAVQIASAIERAKGISPDTRSQTRDRTVTTRTRQGLPWPVIVIGIVVLLVLFRGGGGGGFLAGMLLGNLLGGGRREGGGDWGGGGFGGGDGGGGGFGGFGGGDSGGGGASGSW